VKGRDGRRRRREQAREQVLRSALRLADESPFHDVTVEEIARAAGISRSAFYTHFSDKHDLLLAALREVAAELRRESEGWWDGDGPPAERVREAITGVVSIYAENARLMGVATEVSTYDDEVRAFWVSVLDRFIVETADHIRSEQRAGLIPDMLEPRPTAEGLVWMVERCCYVYLAEGDRAPEKLVADLAPVWVAALYPGVVPATLITPGSSD
jgi:AcrR family transcriptional regulator